jgi:hypothetical protein
MRTDRRIPDSAGRGVVGRPEVIEVMVEPERRRSITNWGRFAGFLYLLMSIICFFALAMSPGS